MKCEATLIDFDRWLIYHGADLVGGGNEVQEYVQKLRDIRAEWGCASLPDEAEGFVDNVAGV